MRKQKFPITAPSMPENILGIECKQLRNKRILALNPKKIRNDE